MRVIALAALNAALLACGQVLWKLGLRQRPLNRLGDLPGVLGNRLVFGGATIYVVATILWLYLLSRAKLSYVYPIQSLAYLFATVAAVTILGEQVSGTRIIGVLTIALGVFLIARS